MNKNKYLYTTPSLVLGCILSWLRQQAGLDQRSMAQFLGITQASWSRIENGLAIANFEQIINSCDAMNIEFVYIAQLYVHICQRLEEKYLIVSKGIKTTSSSEVKNIVKDTVSEHAFLVSKKALNTGF